MTNVIQFPNKSLNKNNKKTIIVNKNNKSGYLIMSSLFCLVLGLSIFNKKIEKGFNSPVQGMRGLASVDNSQFDLNNKELIKLINSKNSRSVASLGVPSSQIDQAFFGDLSDKFRIEVDPGLNLITFLERMPLDDSNEQQFNTKFLDQHKKAFGASRIEILKNAKGEESVVIKDNEMFLVYNLYNSKNSVYAQAKVVTSDKYDLKSIKIQFK